MSHLGGYKRTHNDIESDADMAFINQLTSAFMVCPILWETLCKNYINGKLQGENCSSMTQKLKLKNTIKVLEWPSQNLNPNTFCSVTLNTIHA